MSKVETVVKTLKINRLTNEQYETAVKSDTELYLTPDTTDQDIADAVSTHNSSNSAHSTLFSGKQDTLATQTAYTSKGSATKVPQITTNTLGQVTGITEIDITHQSIKTLNTNNTTAQTANASEDIAGSGSINLHKVSKTGSYNDLLNKPTKLSDFTDDLGTSPVHSHSQYLPLSGGTMTGALKFASGSLTQNTSPVYMLTMDAFADGGELKWISVANIKAGKDASGNTITTTYATKSEATRVKFRDWSAS